MRLYFGERLGGDGGNGTFTNEATKLTKTNGEEGSVVVAAARSGVAWSGTLASGQRDGVSEIVRCKHA
jgi:hypothetical protein